MRDLAGKGGLVWYYLATPLFAFLDLGLGLPVRVAGLGDPVHRAIYYAGLVGLAALVADQVVAGGDVGAPLSVSGVLNAFVVGLVLVVAFHRNQAALGPLGRRRGL